MKNLCKFLVFHCSISIFLLKPLSFSDVVVAMEVLLTYILIHKLFLKASAIDFYIVLTLHYIMELALQISFTELRGKETTL